MRSLAGNRCSEATWVSARIGPCYSSCGTFARRLGEEGRDEEAVRAELLHVLTLPDFDRVGAIQSYWANPDTRTFGELLIDCEEDRVLRAVLVGMLREAHR